MVVLPCKSSLPVVAAAAAALLALSLSFDAASSFSVVVDVAPSGRRSFTPARRVIGSSSMLYSTKGDFPPEEEIGGDAADETSIDWDAEWKKVVRNQGQPSERPGRDFYKSEAEVAAIRAANKASEQASKAANSLPTLPSFDSVKSDWKVRASFVSPLLSCA